MTDLTLTVTRGVPSAEEAAALVLALCTLDAGRATSDRHRVRSRGDGWRAGVTGEHARSAWRCWRETRTGWARPTAPVPAAPVRSLPGRVRLTG